MTEPQQQLTTHGVLKKFDERRVAPFLFLLAGLAVLAGYLFSKINMVGRAGIALFYKEYRFFKVWWKGALVVFAIWMFLFFLHRFLQQKLATAQARLLHVAGLIIAAIGLFFTYQNFRHDLSHRLIGERFHLGFYLFWLGWMLIGLYWLAQKKKPTDSF